MIELSELSSPFNFLSIQEKFHSNANMPLKFIVCLFLINVPNFISCVILCSMYTQTLYNLCMLIVKNKTGQLLHILCMFNVDPYEYVTLQHRNVA